MQMQRYDLTQTEKRPCTAPHPINDLPYTPSPLGSISSYLTPDNITSIEIREKDRLLAADKALRSIQAMVRTVFDEGDVYEPSERGVIALAAKILQEANAGLGQ